VSNTKHVLVPSSFREGDEDRGFCFSHCPRLSNSECRKKHQAGEIEPVGTTGKLWRKTSRWQTTRRTDDCFTARGGKVSLGVPHPVQNLIAAEIGKHAASRTT